MRWLLIGLVVLGTGFAALMLLAPGGGDRDPPAWAGAMGRAALGLAPRVTAFSDGSRLLSIPEGGGELSREIRPDPSRAYRILTLELTGGAGPVRAIHRCTPTPEAPCDDAPQVLCLGARHPDCADQDEFGPRGSFAIGAGGGRLRVLAPGRALLRIGE